MDIDERAWEEAAALHDSVADVLAAGDPGRALAIAQEAATALEGLLGAGHPDAANARVTEAEVLVTRGELQGALTTLTAAHTRLECWRREPAVRAMRIRCRILRGDTLRQLGRYPEALRVLRAAVRMADGGEQALNAWNTLGVALRFAGDFPGAAHAYDRALGLASDAQPRATLHHNLSGLAHARGDLVTAEVEIRRALDLREARDARLGGDLAALAQVLAELGRREEAMQCFAEAHALYEATLPASHPEMAYLLHNLGDALTDAGRFGEAASAYDEAIAIKREVLGDRHPEVAYSLVNSRLALVGLGDEAGALARLTEAREIVRAALPDSHPYRRAVEAAE